MSVMLAAIATNKLRVKSVAAPRKLTVRAASTRNKIVEVTVVRRSSS
jgi:hypothetical protein